jgi:hypothetical protein
MFLSVVILGRFTTETHAMALLRQGPTRRHHLHHSPGRSPLERAVGIYDLEPGQWLELEWPPVAHLWDPGIVYTTELEPCQAHIEQEADDCGAMIRTCG